MYVETDFLFALLKPDDWLADEAEAALTEYDDIHTSILAYAELLSHSTRKMTASTQSNQPEQ